MSKFTLCNYGWRITNINYLNSVRIPVPNCRSNCICGCGVWCNSECINSKCSLKLSKSICTISLCICCNYGWRITNINYLNSTVIITWTWRTHVCNNCICGGVVWCNSECLYSSTWWIQLSKFSSWCIIIPCVIFCNYGWRITNINYLNALLPNCCNNCICGCAVWCNSECINTICTIKYVEARVTLFCRVCYYNVCRVTNIINCKVSMSIRATVPICWLCNYRIRLSINCKCLNIFWVGQVLRIFCDDVYTIN